MSSKRSKPAIDRQRLSMASIIDKLPLLRQLDKSQAALLTVMPIWQRWAANHLAAEHNSSTLPISSSGGALTISCQSPIAASQIKHQQIDLLSALHEAGMDQIKHIKVCMTLDNRANDQIMSKNKPIQPIGDDHQTNIDREKPSASAIKSIEHCEKTIHNEQLADSLKRLALTLKKAPS